MSRPTNGCGCQDGRVGDPAGPVAFDAEEAAGRRRRGLIIVAVIAVIGIPLTLAGWWAEREVERAADELADELLVAAEQVGDPVALAGDEVLSWGAGEPSPVIRVLGRAQGWRGVAPVDGGFVVAYEVTRWLESRCVKLLVTAAGALAQVDDGSRCGPRWEGS